jgi:hypothetical protein
VVEEVLEAVAAVSVVDETPTVFLATLRQSIQHPHGDPHPERLLLARLP